MNLELKIPPPVVMFAVGAGMWAIARFTPPLPLPWPISPTADRIIGAVLMLGGLALNVAGVLTVRRAGTTFNPVRPETTTALVSSGLFGVSRNPMYLAMLVVLLGWAVYLNSLPALLCPGVFVLYINRFQIAPEERALRRLFGPRFTDYTRKVRRWI